jgi:hypothetical protein
VAADRTSQAWVPHSRSPRIAGSPTSSVMTMPPSRSSVVVMVASSARVLSITASGVRSSGCRTPRHAAGPRRSRGSPRSSPGW